jgi:hypothetical protein
MARAVVPLLLACLPLAACGGGERTLAERLGMGRQAPDEFQVVERAPLVVPPEFGLRPPEPGVPRPQEGRTSEQAQRALLGDALAPAPETTGQLALLDSAGVDRADPNIREVLTDETTGLAGLDESRFWFILDFQRRAYSQVDGTPLDATAEAQRLAEAGVTVRSTRLGSEPIPPTGGL